MTSENKPTDDVPIQKTEALTLTLEVSLHVNSDLPLDAQITDISPSADQKTGQSPDPEPDVDVEASAPADGNPEPEPATPSVIDDVNLKPGTWKFKTLSVLYHSDRPLTAEEIEWILDGTDWERDKSVLSTTLGKLYRDALVEREDRPTDHNGSNPYEYVLNDDGTTVLEDANDRVDQYEARTYLDVVGVADPDDPDAPVGLDALLGDDPEDTDGDGLDNLFPSLEASAE